MNSHSFQLLLAFGIAIIIYLVYTARKFTKAPIAMVEVAATRSVEVNNDRKFEVHNDRGFEVYNPRGYEIFNPREIRIYKLRLVTKGLMAAGGLLLIWILRSIVIGPIAGLMSKGYLAI